MRPINRRKSHKSLITYTYRRDPGKQNHGQNGHSPHLKYCLQLKNKDVRRGGLGTLEEMNAIHMEIENKCLGKQRFTLSCRDNKK